MFTSKKKGIIIFVAIVLLIGVPAVLYSKYKNSVIVQPVAFNHYKHVKDNHMDCTDCHKYALTDINASIPNIETCALCHSEDTLPDDPSSQGKLVKVIDSIKKKEQIAWQRLFKLPEHVYFSHRRHTFFGELECVNCHGDMGSQTAPPARTLKTLSMNDCEECHISKKVSVDCITCHK